MKKYLFLRLATATLLGMLIVAQISWRNELLPTVMYAFFVFFSISILVLYKTPREKRLKGLLIMIGTQLVLIWSEVLITWDVVSHLAYMSMDIFEVLAMWLAYAFLQWRRWKAWILAMFIVLLFTIYKQFLYEPIKHWQNFGILSAKIEDPEPAAWMNKTVDSVLVKSLSANKEIIVLDFWFTRCASCIESFPKLEELYTRYKTQPSVQFFSVNYPIGEDTLGEAKYILKEYGVTLPMIIADTTLPGLFSVESYPTVIVISNHKVVRRGTIKNAEEYLTNYF